MFTFKGPQGSPEFVGVKGKAFERPKTASREGYTQLALPSISQYQLVISTRLSTFIMLSDYLRPPSWCPARRSVVRKRAERNKSSIGSITCECQPTRPRKRCFGGSMRACETLWLFFVRKIASAVEEAMSQPAAEATSSKSKPCSTLLSMNLSLFEKDK